MAKGTGFGFFSRRKGKGARKPPAADAPAPAARPMTPEREALIDEALRIRAQVREKVDEKTLRRLYHAITGKEAR